jgi:hypothetical protein
MSVIHINLIDKRKCNCIKCGCKGRFFDPIRTIYIADDWTIMHSPSPFEFKFENKIRFELRDTLERVCYCETCVDGCESIIDRLNRLKRTKINIK